ARVGRRCATSNSLAIWDRIPNTRRTTDPQNAQPASPGKLVEALSTIMPTPLSEDSRIDTIRRARYHRTDQFRAAAFPRAPATKFLHVKDEFVGRSWLCGWRTRSGWIGGH